MLKSKLRSILPALVLGMCFTVVYGQRSIKIHQLREALQIDGIHETKKWEGAAVASDFIQMEPEPGDRASLPSEIYIGQDKENIFLSAIFFQETEVNASIQSRDQFSTSDDCFMLI